MHLGLFLHSAARLFLLLDVETIPLPPLDTGGRRCRFRPTLLAGRPGGPHHHPGHRPAPMPSPIAGAAPKPPPCIASSGNTWRPTSPWPMSPMGTACRITWRRSSGAISDAAFWPTASRGLGARAAVMTSWWRFPARAGEPAPHATPSAWLRRRLTLWTTSFPTCPSANGSSPCPNASGLSSITGAGPPAPSSTFCSVPFRRP